MENNELKSLQTFLKEYWEDVTYGSEVFTTEDGLRFENIEEVVYDTARWSTPIFVITKGPSGQHYGWEWHRGNTEMQDSYRYVERVYRVNPQEVTTIEWIVDNT